MEILKFAAGLLLLVPCVLGEESLSVGKIEIVQAGQSGKMKLLAKGEEDSVSPVFIILDSLQEVDAQGEAVGVGGQEKHSFNSFATQDFTFSDLETGDVPYSNVSATYFTFESQLSGLTSRIKVFFYIITEDGQLELDNEVQELRRGQIKFAIELSNWSWCGCQQGQQQEVGEFVDLEITIQSSGCVSKEDDSSSDLDHYSLGGEGTMAVSKKVKPLLQFAVGFGGIQVHVVV